MATEEPVKKRDWEPKKAKHAKACNRRSLLGEEQALSMLTTTPSRSQDRHSSIESDPTDLLARIGVLGETADSSSALVIVEHDQDQPKDNSGEEGIGNERARRSNRTLRSPAPRAGLLQAENSKKLFAPSTENK